MILKELKIARGYNPKTQKLVGLFAAQLDDQLVRLKNHTKDLTVKQLEWQLKPGMNTIGMLLAHLALVEIFWTKVAPSGMKWDPDGKKVIKKICGFKDDGLPLSPKGKHPSYLKKYSAKKYLAILDKARRTIHAEMKKWKDNDLNKKFNLANRKFTYSWTLYHILEHFAAHFGQILLLKHMMKDAGVLKGK